MRKKLLLCRPKGGLNDTLCQISICRDYASKYDRRLMVDTKRGSLGVSVFEFLVPFAESENSFMYDPESVYSQLNDYQRVVPPELARRVDDFKLQYRREYRDRVISGTDVRVAFELECDYSETLLVHAQSGGGVASINVLSHAAFSPPVAQAIGKVIAKLGPNYLAAHIRNTDMNTDYHSFFEDIKPRVEGRRLLICSDDAKCKAYAHDYFDKTEVLESSETPDTQGKRLHDNSMQSPHDRLMAVFVDLMALSMSDRIFITEARVGQNTRSKLSGFSLLAAALHKDHLVRNRLLTSAHHADRVAMGFDGCAAWDAPDSSLSRMSIGMLPVEVAGDSGDLRTFGEVNSNALFSEEQLSETKHSSYDVQQQRSELIEALIKERNAAKKEGTRLSRQLERQIKRSHVFEAGAKRQRKRYKTLRGILVFVSLGLLIFSVLGVLTFIL